MKLRSGDQMPEKSGLPSCSLGAGPVGTLRPLLLGDPSSWAESGINVTARARAAAISVDTNDLFMRKTRRAMPLSRHASVTQIKVSGSLEVEREVQTHEPRTGD